MLCGNIIDGKVMKLVPPLYGLEISGVSWRKMFKYHIVNCLGFAPSTIDPDMYYRCNTKEDSTDYYDVLLVFVDNVLACIHDAKAVMAGIAAKFEINNDKIAEPKLYLGGNIEKFQLPNGKYARSINYNSYVKGDIDTAQRLFSEDVRTFNTGKGNHKVLLPHGYKPELDTTDECDAYHTSRYQQLIGILRWAVELERIEIQLDTALISQ